jgi:hypothetical protein
MMLAITEAHDLDEALATFEGPPVGADLLEDFEVIAAEALEGLANAPDQPLMLLPFLAWDDVAIGLQKHLGDDPQSSPGKKSRAG